MASNLPLRSDFKTILYLSGFLIFASLSCNSPYLLQKVPVEALSYLGMEPSIDMLIRATADGNLPKIKELLAAGVDINAATDRGYTPLHIAVLQGNVELVAFLLENGADPTVYTVDYETPGTLAREKQNQEIVTLIAAFLVNHKESPQKKVASKIPQARPTEQTAIVPPPDKNYVEGYTISACNLRAEPIPISSLITKIPKGAQIFLYNEIIKGYVKIKYQNQTGYILTIDVAPEALQKIKS